VCRDIVAIESEAQPIQLSELKITSGEIVIEKHTRKAKRTHEEAFEHLPVEEVIHEVENKICEKCGEEMVVIGKEKVRDELVYVPARIFVRRHFAEIVKCSSCGSDETRDAQLTDIEACTIRQAFVPAPVIPHSYCSTELLAHIVYEKYRSILFEYQQTRNGDHAKRFLGDFSEYLVCTATTSCLPLKDAVAICTCAVNS